MAPADAEFAALVTGFVVDNWYIANTLIGKTFGWNVFIKIDHKDKYVYWKESKDFAKRNPYLESF